MIEVKLRFSEPPGDAQLSELLSAAREVDRSNCATWTNDGKQWTLLVHTKSRSEGKDAQVHLESIAKDLGLTFKTMRMVEAKTEEE